MDSFIGSYMGREVVVDSEDDCIILDNSMVILLLDMMKAVMNNDYILEERKNL